MLKYVYIVGFAPDGWQAGKKEDQGYEKMRGWKSVCWFYF